MPQMEVHLIKGAEAAKAELIAAAAREHAKLKGNSIAALAALKADVLRLRTENANLMHELTLARESASSGSAKVVELKEFVAHLQASKQEVWAAFLNDTQLS